MLETEQLQQRLQIRKVQLPLYLMGRIRRDIAIGCQVQRGLRLDQVFIQIGLLARQAETQPLGKNLMMTVA